MSFLHPKPPQRDNIEYCCDCGMPLDDANPTRTGQCPGCASQE